MSKSAMTTNVYGRRSASLTIHIRLYLDASGNAETSTRICGSEASLQEGAKKIFIPTHYT